jgi:hypothetical protein
MEFALPLVAAVARHIHFAMGAFSKGDLVGAAAFSSAADACFRRASEYHSDIDGFNDFTSLRDSIEEMLKGDLPEAQKHAGEFVASMLDYEKRIVGKGGEPLRPPAKMP